MTNITTSEDIIVLKTSNGVIMTHLNPYTATKFASPEEELAFIANDLGRAVDQYCPDHTNDPRAHLVIEVRQALSILSHQLTVANNNIDTLKKRRDELTKENNNLMDMVNIRNSHWRLKLEKYQQLINLIVHNMSFWKRGEIKGQLKLLESALMGDITGG